MSCCREDRYLLGRFWGLSSCPVDLLRGANRGRGVAVRRPAPWRLRRLGARAQHLLPVIESQLAKSGGLVWASACHEKISCGRGTMKLGSISATDDEMRSDP